MNKACYPGNISILAIYCRNENSLEKGINKFYSQRIEEMSYSDQRIPVNENLNKNSKLFLLSFFSEGVYVWDSDCNFFDFQNSKILSSESRWFEASILKILWEFDK